MTPVVVDASTVASWVFDEEFDSEAERTISEVTERGAIVPSLWTWEVENLLRMSIRRGRISEEYAFGALRELSELPIEVDSPTGVTPRWSPAFMLAGRLGLTVYDAAYVDLALRLNTRLATRDKKMAAAAQSVGVSPL